MGGQSQFNLDCCPYWLGTNGEWKATQVIDKDGWYFDDMTVPTRWFRFALQGNFDMLSFIKGNERWSLDLSPQISLVNTKSKWTGPLSAGQGYHEEELPANWHLGLGAQIGAGYAITPKWKVGLYGGLTALTGKRFDMIPTKVHKTNVIWDAGIKLTFSLGESRKKAAIAAEAAEAERLAAEQAARDEAARLAAQKAEAERLAAEKAAREEAERLAAEKAASEAAEKEAAFRTTLTVYFDNGKVHFDDSYVPGLEHILELLNKYPDFKLQIRGYASTSGSAYNNKRLSELRMEEVQYWFIGHQVAPERAEDVLSLGEDANAASEAEARRVEVNFVK